MHTLRKEKQGYPLYIAEHQNNRYGEVVYLITLSNIEFIQLLVLEYLGFLFTDVTNYRVILINIA